MRYATRFLVPVGSTLAMALLLFAGCARRPAETPTAPPPIAVSVSLPVEREVTDYADFTGRTAAVDSVEVRARVSGYLDQVNFKEGALVKKGDLLFVIDPRPFVAELNRAKAQLEQAKASVVQSTAQLAQAQAQESKADASLDYAKRRLERTTSLTARQVTSKDELQLHQSEMLQAQADLEGSRAQIASSRAAIATAKAAVEAAEAAIGIAELDLEYTKVIAPVSGRVSRDAGHRGQPGPVGTEGGGTLLTTIVSVDPMYAYFDVDEHTVLRVRQLIREGKAKSARDVGSARVLLGLANEEGLSPPGHDQLRGQPGQSARPARCGCAACSPTRTRRSLPAFSPASACPSANRTRPCWSPTAPSTTTRARRSSTSSTRRTRWSPAPSGLGRCTTACG